MGKEAGKENEGKRSRGNFLRDRTKKGGGKVKVKRTEKRKYRYERIK